MTSDVLDQLEENIDNSPLGSEVSDELIAILRDDPDAKKDWEEVLLADAIDLIIDHRGLTPKKLGGDWANEGYRAVSAKTIKAGSLVNEDQMNILPEYLYRKWMKVEVERGDVLLTSEAPLGEHIIWNSDEKIVLSQRIFGIRTNKQKLDPRFFNYFIDSNFYQHQLKSRESGSTVSGIKQSELLKTKLRLPPLHIQKQISDLFFVFDEKIELLRAQNKTLESLSNSLYCGQETDVVSLSDVCDVKYGKSLTSIERTGKGFPVFGSSGIVGAHQSPLIKEKGIVVGRKGNVGSVFFSASPFFPIDTTFYIQESASRYPIEYLYVALTANKLADSSEDSAVPGLNIDLLKRTQINIGTIEMYLQISSCVNSMQENSATMKVLSQIKELCMRSLM